MVSWWVYIYIIRSAIYFLFKYVLNHIIVLLFFFLMYHHVITLRKIISYINGIYIEENHILHKLKVGDKLTINDLNI